MDLLRVLIHWFGSGLAIAATAWVVPGFRVRGFTTALAASVLLAVANAFVRPVLILLTLPLTILTLGLFLLVVDAIVLRLCAALLRGFELDGWLASILAVIVLAITNGIVHAVLA